MWEIAPILGCTRRNEALQEAIASEITRAAVMPVDDRSASHGVEV